MSLLLVYLVIIVYVKNEILRQLQKMLQYRTIKKPESDIDKEYPPIKCRTSWSVADVHMMDHVLTNLIGNAVKYLDPKKDGEIRISGKVEDGMSIYCVADNGVGIAEGHQGKVFEIFHRLDPEGSAEGEGLGLTIVTRIIDRLGGKIWIESEPDIGSKFFFELATGS